jgi:uncharacterized protein YndB with AHSA1/START domain
MSKLQVSLEGANEIHMTRTFDAPKRLVLRAMTTPDLIKQWLGGVRATVESVEVDFRVGGTYRYCFLTRDGQRFALFGTYREIAEDRVVHTESMEGMPGESVITSTLVEKDGKTTLSLVMRFPSQEIRDIVVRTGMSDGAGESYDELEKLLATL